MQSIRDRSSYETLIGSHVEALLYMKNGPRLDMCVKSSLEINLSSVTRIHGNAVAYTVNVHTKGMKIAHIRAVLVAELRVCNQTRPQIAHCDWLLVVKASRALIFVKAWLTASIIDGCGSAYIRLTRAECRMQGRQRPPPPLSEDLAAVWVWNLISVQRTLARGRIAVLSPT